MPEEPETPRQKFEAFIAAVVLAAKLKLAGKDQSWTERQWAAYEADVRVKVRRTAAWEPRKKTKPPFDRRRARQKNRMASRARARNRA